MKTLFYSIVFCVSIIGCGEGSRISETFGPSPELPDKIELATLAGGCFWCMEPPFEDLDGVVIVLSGYSGGKEKNPTYGEVSGGRTSHQESVQITYDPRVIGYPEIIDLYWKQFDPTDGGGSFYDRGNQYKSAIFYHSEVQMKIAAESKDRLNKSGIFDKPVVTEIKKYDAFYPAEDYHQDYYKKNPVDYKRYRNGSGRDRFIEAHWEIPSQQKYPRASLEEIKKQLTPLQYSVTIEGSTEKPFENEYNKNYESGIYVCIISGAPLFSSADKFDSGTGWPSFTKPIDVRCVKKIVKYSDKNVSVEVRSRFGDSHLGDLFTDGPAPTNLRYCMNSAALKFIPKEKMKELGYEHYLWLVE